VAKRLKQIQLDEISLVSAPANRKKFYIIKEQKCPDCGGILKQMRIDEDEACTQLKCSECGRIIESSTIKEVFEMEDLMKIYKELTGDSEDFSEEQISILKAMKEETLNAIKGALNMLNKYKADMPKDLKDAVDVLAKYVTGKAPYPYPYPTKKDAEILDQLIEKHKKEVVELEKAGKKLSKDTIEKIRSVIKSLAGLPDAIKTLQSLLPEGEEVKKDTNEDDKSGELAEQVKKEFTDKLGEIVKSIEKMTEESKKTAEEVKKSAEDMDKRLTVLEEEKGIKKSIDGEGDDDEDEEAGNFPSITKALQNG